MVFEALKILLYIHSLIEYNKTLLLYREVPLLHSRTNNYNKIKKKIDHRKRGNVKKYFNVDRKGEKR